MILAKKKLIDSEPSLWLSNQNMRELFFLFFFHPLGIVRTDSTTKRSLGPMKVKETQGSYWDLKFYLFRANMFISSTITV